MSVTVARPPYAVVTGRLVFTVLDPVTGWPRGVLTGYGADNRRFVLEHVLAYTPGAMLPLLREGLRYARETAGFRCITFSIPDDFPPAARLALVATRLGFTLYDHRDGWTSWARWL